MAYVFDSVVVALGGKNLTSSSKEGVTVKSWTPNLFKRVAILTDGILVEYHGLTPRSRVLPFDIVKVSEDLAQGGKYKNPLRPLYEFKALSCLEEVIVSSSLVTDSMVRAYISTIVDTHRLRVVGVVPSNLKVQDVNSLLEKLNSEESTRSRLISELVRGTNSFSTDNNLYYKKFYLRPTMYDLDKPNGALRRYFEGIKSEMEARSSSKDKQDLVNSYISYDKGNIDFWTVVVDFLSNQENSKKYSSLYSSIKNNAMANGGCYLDGLVGYFESKGKSEEIYKVYKVLGYLDTKGVSTPNKEAKGYLRKLEGVVNNSYKEVLAVAQKDTDGILGNLNFPKGSSKEYILKEVLKVLNSESVGTSDEKVTSESRIDKDINESLKEDIEKVLPESLMVSLFDLWESLQEEYRETAGMLLSARGTGFPYRFSEKGLRGLGLERHAEVLSLLGYCGGSEVLSNLSTLSFTSGLDSLCHMATRGSLAELRARSWESLSDTEKCNYITRRL